MNESKISVRYSKALLQVAVEQQKLDVVYQDIMQISKICKEVEEFMDILNIPVIPQSKKKKIIGSVFDGKVADLTLSFLKMIVHNKRETYIPDIARRFIYDYKKHRGITTVVLSTVIPLDQQLKDRITKLIRDYYHTTVLLEEKQNKELIGGFIIRIDDKMMDASVVKELKTMRKELVTAEYKRK